MEEGGEGEGKEEEERGRGRKGEEIRAALAGREKVQECSRIHWTNPVSGIPFWNRNSN